MSVSVHVAARKELLSSSHPRATSWVADDEADDELFLFLFWSCKIMHVGINQMF